MSILHGCAAELPYDGYGVAIESCSENENGELWVRNLYIAEYKYGTDSNHLPRRNRKLLLRKPELRKLERGTREKGSTIVPYKLFISDRGFAKLTIELARGKKMFDKRETIKEREGKRDMDRINKAYKIR